MEEKEIEEITSTMAKLAEKERKVATLLEELTLTRAEVQRLQQMVIQYYRHDGI